MNNNLIIFYKDKSRDVFTFPIDTDEQEAFEAFGRLRPDVNKEDIEKYFYRKLDKASPDIYGKYGELDEDKKIKLDLRKLIIDKRVEDIRRKRDSILSSLDVPFMRALEEEDGLVKGHITYMKKFLRDLPDNLKFHTLKTEEEIIKYNPFGNIFEMILLISGTGYERPPKITIDPPTFGSGAKAISFIKDGKITKVQITDYGHGYDFLPRTVIEDSNTGEKSEAICGLPQNCFLAEEDILLNTQKYYLES